LAPLLPQNNNVKGWGRSLKRCTRSEEEMSNSNKEFLIKDFEQAWENLRASDNKRDIIVGFYITLIGVIGSFTLKNYKILQYAQELIKLGLFFLWIVGFLIFGILIRYRWWHEQWRVYANRIRITFLGKSNIKQEWAKDTHPKPLTSGVQSFV